MTEAIRVQKWCEGKLGEYRESGTVSVDPDARSITLHLGPERVAFEIGPFVQDQVECLLKLMRENAWVLDAAQRLKASSLSEDDISAEYGDLPGFVREQFDYMEFEEKVESIVAQLKRGRLDFPVDLFFDRPDKGTLRVRRAVQ